MGIENARGRGADFDITRAEAVAIVAAGAKIHQLCRDLLTDRDAHGTLLAVLSHAAMLKDRIDPLFGEQTFEFSPVEKVLFKGFKEAVRASHPAVIEPLPPIPVPEPDDLSLEDRIRRVLSGGIILSSSEITDRVDKDGGERPIGSAVSTELRSMANAGILHRKGYIYSLIEVPSAT